MLTLSKSNNYTMRGFIGEDQPFEEDIDKSSYARTVTIDTYNSLKTLKNNA